MYTNCLKFFVLFDDVQRAVWLYLPRNQTSVVVEAKRRQTRQIGGNECVGSGDGELGRGSKSCLCTAPAAVACLSKVDFQAAWTMPKSESGTCLITPCPHLLLRPFSQSHVHSLIIYRLALSFVQKYVQAGLVGFLGYLDGE